MVSATSLATRYHLLQSDRVELKLGALAYEKYTDGGFNRTVWN